MELKYSQAIKAGAIGGIIIIVLILLKLVVDFLSMTVNSIIVCGVCCVWVPVLVAMVAIGALAVRFAWAGIRSLNDASISGAVAGMVAGIPATIVMMIESIIEPILIPGMHDWYSSISNTPSAGITPLSGGLAGVCCCGPILFVLCVVGGAIGGVIYYMIKK
ncbi:MAG TPA: hypothetical protein VK436_08675 [Methanocella sp.]|nr:hypothetical protein [Methanocella sp.]